MSRFTLSEEEKDYLKGVVRVIIARTPDRAGEAARMLAAIDKDSPVLEKRLSILVDNALSSGGHYEFSHKEQHQLGDALLFLEEKKKGKAAGRYLISMSQEYADRLEDLTERTGMSRSAVIRKALDHYEEWMDEKDGVSP